MSKKTLTIRGRIEAGDLAIEITGPDHHASATIRNIRNADLRCNAEALIALGLLPAMASDATRLHVADQPEISARFLEHVQKLQEIYRLWYPGLTPVEIVGPTAAADPPATEADRVGMFFSCGVDSFYTFAKHREQITDLIFLHGWDFHLEDAGLRERLSAHLQEVAAEAGMGLIEVEARMFEYFESQNVDWMSMAHGCVLAAAAHLLSGAFGRIFIASSFDYAHLKPWGSHPMTDPLWSSGKLELIHDGCEATRFERTRRIAESDLAMKHLNVCAKKRDDAYNCGRCEKCLRTMLALLAVGRLEACATFPGPIRVEDIHRIDMKPYKVGLNHFHRENLGHLEKLAGHEEIKKVVRYALDRPLWRYRLDRWCWSRMRSLRKRLPFLTYDPDAPR